MKFKLSKMQVELNQPVAYALSDANNKLAINELLGKNISFNFDGEIRCVKCDKKTNKSFGQGFCFPCFRSAPENSECIIRPELCEAHIGKGRDVEWEQKHHNQPHIVYLALTNVVKVGVTRSTNLPSRWIDQGAWKTMILAEVPNRFLAGKIEVALKDFVTDKTNWQRMLKDEKDSSLDLIQIKNELISKLNDELQQYKSNKEEKLEIEFPVNKFPTKVKSINLDKEPKFTEKLVGIKGQYLIFESERVINIRKYSGYVVDISC
jgi:hypothetical protein